ncbi:MAG TPA: D-alanyl-D-alanine carboxypeptidase/D-alanyl-D-alanine-endopeptidase [Thermoanaerobaculia bacterium]|nr:D-alanyl-D-alanine carboxypeptidase/D-alanyl-D-alanine-endopeptidase [Thermoanaerobaculia bacterium]
MPPTPLTRPPRRLALWLLLAVLGGQAGPAAAVEATAPDPRGALAQAVSRAGRGMTLGVHVVELGGGGEVYGYNADTRLVPASNQKLLTTAAALELLGPSYQFQTQLGMRGELAAGALAGDLAVRGAGDPTISGRFEAGDPYAVFRRWAGALRQAGVERVEGDLYLEHGLFDDVLVHPDWPAEQQMWWYEAPVAALSFNDNCMLLRAWGGRPGHPGVVETLPRLDGLLQIRNGLRTTGRGKHHWAVDRKPGSRLVTVGGEVSPRHQPLDVWVTVVDPVEYFGAALRAALAEGGVVVAGALRPVERLPGPWWTLVATHRTTLVTALDVTNKRSQNFYAESLYKLLGALRCNDGSWRGGRQALEEYLTGRLGWNADSFRLADGSGMSRHNGVTPRNLSGLLRHMFGHRWGVEYVRSLPYSGEEAGSLRKRLTEPPYRGNVFAKTGTLGGVSALSGYAKGRSGRLYAFAIVCNRTTAWEGRRAQDAVVQALIDHG